MVGCKKAGEMEIVKRISIILIAKHGLMLSSHQRVAWCVLVRNEWRMRNHHPTGGRRIRGMNDLPAEGYVADNIGVLVNAGAGSRQITNYASNSLAQERLKEMLHLLKQVEGSNVLLIQHDLDITCDIVLQTRVQKLAVGQWSENLTLDFTHGTNNPSF
ncbi:hypothetical protein PHMEG_0004128 [Phytophthora megakarya]|uniref:Uncharacterized protein n=1 Tax=Phytophthora megakarya TaxID=4795 RepID=A0A225WUI7_9STRA|nr:hypothetical protein PHMEG_0004128 [Phytophthora megakarya]